MQVKIARPCHCVIKNDIETIHHCADINEARLYAKNILKHLEANNCKAHHFFIRENEEEIIIDSKFNVDDIFI